MKEGRGLDHPIFRAVFDSRSLLCFGFETARKRLLRRLPLIKLKIIKKEMDVRV